MKRRRLSGWHSEQQLSAAGAVDSTQRVLTGEPVVPDTPAGAARLGEVYWAEVRRATAGLVRPRATSAGLGLRLLGRGPALLCFGPPVLAASGAETRCAFPIRGGALARVPGGEIAFEQVAGDQVELSSTIRGFFPALAAPGAPRWAGLLYSHGQRRLHQAISRRFFLRLTSDGRV